MGTMNGKWDEEYSHIQKDKGEIGFIDYEDNVSVCTYNPEEEGPIVISVPFPLQNGKPRSILVGETSSDPITIKNTTGDPVDLWKVDIYDSNPKESFTVSLMEPPSTNMDLGEESGFVESFCLEDRVLQPGQTLTVWLSCKPKGIGLHQTAVHFDLENERIERVVLLFVEDKISKSLVSKKPYCRDRRKKPFVKDVYATNAFVPGQRPASRPSNRGSRFHLAEYLVPKQIREMVENKMVPDVITEGVTRRNYGIYFTTLMNLEEIQVEENMGGYDMEHICLRKKGSFLTLEVPGLAERRPSLIKGDFIYAKLATEDANDENRTYQGYIHRVEAEEVYLKFDHDEEFHSLHNIWNLYNVHFTYNRVIMRKLYQAIEAAERLDKEFLFPSESNRKRQIRRTQLSPLSSILNEEQKRSIEMILGCEGGPPYVIHGPPGTGKTVTLVETLLQLYTNRKDARLLVCAPSNSAADHILEKLVSQKEVSFRKNDILRLNAINRPLEDYQSDRQFCSIEDSSSSFCCPPLNTLMRYRIIISTYMSASQLYAEGIRRDHFSHIFLDEAGQASEPETLIPLSHLCRRETVVVLAGDPMQLGPVIHSRHAETYGLGKSFLERLFECEFYYTGNENYVTKLVRNYRCHPEILHLPSELFYNGELIASKERTCESVAWVDLLPNGDFPVLFVGIQGCDEREGNNPSWFNRFEISKVVEYIKKLTEEKGLNGEDIGVIAPYRQQVLKLSNTLESLDSSGIKVGSVEQFQGQEREVIIISTVRSTVKHNEFDQIHCLGFLSNPKRFNVAITRARSLLIVIGNPHIIGKDPHWNLLLWHCVDNGSYQGCPLPERQNSLPDESYSACDDEYPQLTDELKECHLGNEEEYPVVSDEVEPGIQKPCFDESEWSDGWK